jgi:hypothetical protein
LRWTGTPATNASHTVRKVFVLPADAIENSRIACARAIALAHVGTARRV